MSYFFKNTFEVWRWRVIVEVSVRLVRRNEIGASVSLRWSALKK